MVSFVERHLSEQYFTSSQFLAQLLRHVISRLQTVQILLGKLDLLPLKVVLLMIGFESPGFCAIQSKQKNMDCIGLETIDEC